jgi:hypothetical protein
MKVFFTASMSTLFFVVSGFLNSSFAVMVDDPFWCPVDPATHICMEGEPGGGGGDGGRPEEDYDDEEPPAPVETPPPAPAPEDAPPPPEPERADEESADEDDSPAVCRQKPSLPQCQ